MRFLSDTVESKKHDNKLVDETEYSLPNSSKLVQDTGFQGFTLQTWPFFSPKRNPEANLCLTWTRALTNGYLLSLRVRIEHVTGGAKRYRIVNDKAD